jgi:hypothetical protein
MFAECNEAEQYNNKAAKLTICLGALSVVIVLELIVFHCKIFTNNC